MSRRFRFTALLLPALLSISSWSQQPQASQTTVTPSVHQPQSNASDVDGYIKDLDYLQLARSVEGMPPSLDRDYFAGVLANRQGHVEASIALLTKVLPQLETSKPTRAAVALHTLADDYVKAYRYADAIPVYEDLLHHFAAQMDKTERQSTDDDYRATLLLRDAPPQTIAFQGPVDVPTHRNPVLGTIEATLKVNGVEESWILDTGANLSTVSASFARKLGVPVSKEAAQTQGITGAENKLHIAILPELNIGAATLHNVVLLVLEDANLNVVAGKDTRYQIQAVLGYPVMQALQRVTFTRDGHFLAGPDSPSSENGALLYMNELTPLLECKVQDRAVLFSFDTGANATVYSDRYYRDFPMQFRGLKKKKYGMSGAGGVKLMKAYYLPQAQLQVGTTLATLHDVPVVPLLGTDMDRLYGNLGRDLVDPYSRFTIDFTNMRFLIAGKPTAAASLSK